MDLRPLTPRPAAPRRLLGLALVLALVAGPYHIIRLTNHYPMSTTAPTDLLAPTGNRYLDSANARLDAHRAACQNTPLAQAAARHDWATYSRLLNKERAAGARP